MTETKPLPFWSPAEIQGSMRRVISHLENAGVLAYPTETVYGFGGAADQAGVEALVAMKGRPPGKPFLLLISGSEMLAKLGLHLPPYAAHLAARHWPGPLTMVLPGGERRVPERLRGPEGGIAVRWTPHPGLTQLLRAYGQPITSTSANRPGVPPAMSAGEIVDAWQTEVARGRLVVLDGGRLHPSPASTVVDCTGRRPRVIRPGAISADILRESVPDLVGNV
ncbi:MAG: threonylcarbamoyl-AMP synthase [Gemmatimonadaceae bacterium]|nr:threonylcarbamoyl-AMP synthase [Gemmatimonadaceae bacterium]NUQ93425.1 threonylcarbamoyl-AMP synthase [Gemmatimonadaceae bacterium]NUR20118.1 threonylcarbamoyl-AMP synthase [Gemmatimonadaceae bacterium]NUS97368.1 threonylcarbamoyl-AMP synthase [Gemmatimonadaceae bacterium]